MSERKRGNALNERETALIKAMLNRGGYNDQDILAYFTRPERSINQACIAEIRTDGRFKTLDAASDEELDEFLRNWPDIDAETGLSPRGDELLIKAREAMIAAIHTFNGAGLTFRTELFIVTSIIAWTYLLHAWFRREDIDCRYKDKDGTVQKTKQGADCYWDLSKCLRHNRCPLPKGAVRNLNFILGLRHEIEHRSTNRIDDAISAKLQACCLNFNNAIKKAFGPQYGLERRLSIALQFVTFDAGQRTALKKESGLPQHIETFIKTSEDGLTKEEYADPAYGYRVAFIPIAGNRASSADIAVKFVKEDSDEAREIDRVLFKQVEKNRYTATKVCELMQAEGYPNFKRHNHTRLWQKLDGKNPAHGYGCEGGYKGQWLWYDKWIKRVRAHCQEEGEHYK